MFVLFTFAARTTTADATKRQSDGHSLRQLNIPHNTTQNTTSKTIGRLSRRFIGSPVRRLRCDTNVRDNNRRLVAGRPPSDRKPGGCLPWDTLPTRMFGRPRVRVPELRVNTHGSQSRGTSRRPLPGASTRLTGRPQVGPLRVSHPPGRQLQCPGALRPAGPAAGSARGL